MNKMITLALVGASALAVTAGAASAQNYGARHHNAYQHSNWQNINQRQAQLDRRIDQGLRNGSLTRAEAARLRAEFRTIARLEARYRVNGLNNWERADLDRRFDRLQAQIRYERRDRDYGYGYGPGYRR